ncbi:hypothetical protein Nmel_017085 [Mimus melanotis]
MAHRICSITPQGSLPSPDPIMNLKGSAGCSLGFFCALLGLPIQVSVSQQGQMWHRCASQDRTLGGDCDPAGMGSHPKENQPQTSPLSHSPQIRDRTGPELLFTAQSLLLLWH